MDPMVVDLDYVLGCFLSQWYLETSADSLRLKGGTCLRKCYFPDYRFSEDLDFSAEVAVAQEELEGMVARTIQSTQDSLGIDLGIQAPRVRVIRDRDGETYYEVRLYYRGPLRRTGAPRGIRLHVSLGEALAMPAEVHRILHPYGDEAIVSATQVYCYSLPEILAEKLRALCGQRRFALSRDLYDIEQLIVRAQVGLQSVAAFLEAKFAARGMSVEQVDLNRFANRREEFALDWDRNLKNLLPASDATRFGEAWETGLEVVSWVSSLAKGG